MAGVKEFYKRDKSLLIIFMIMVAYYIQHLVSFRLGINFEECRDPNAYLLAMEGHLPYRDFAWFYGPFSFFVYPFIMKIFGVNLLVLRLSYIILASFTIPLAYFLARRILPYFWAGVASFLSIVFFDTPYYAFNHIFTVLGGLACLLMVCRFIERNEQISNLFWAGIFAGVVVLTKPLLSGLVLFIAVSLYLLLFRELGELKKRFKNYMIFAISMFFLILLYLLYLYFQTTLKGLTIAYPFLGRDSLVAIENMHGNTKFWPLFLMLVERLKGIIPIAEIVSISSFNELKGLMVDFFDDFIFLLPFMASGLIFLVYIVSKSNKITPWLKEKVLLDKKFLLMFIIFSIFISLEGIKVGHRYNRAYTMQVPFILTVYILYFIKSICSRRRILTAIFVTLFLFYLSFLHFFRYPYSMIRKYTEPLNLDRARIFLTLPEKELYQSLVSHLSANFKKEDRMAVIGYSGCYSQFSFLTKQRNVFEDHEFIFAKLKSLLNTSYKREEVKPQLASFEDRIISRMEREKPKIILIIVKDSLQDQRLKDYKFLSSRIKSYIKRNYLFDKVFGPADIHGLGGRIGWINLYKLKGASRS